MAVAPLWVSEAAGVGVRRCLPTPELAGLDPFLLFDHIGSTRYESRARRLALEPRPGLVTLTYVLAGFLGYRTGEGAAVSLGPGDAQWRTAGAGEGGEEFPTSGPRGMSALQLWVRVAGTPSPAQSWNVELPSHRVQEVATAQGARVRIVAGSCAGVSSRPAMPGVRRFLDVTLPPTARFSEKTPAAHTTFVYLLEGSGRFGLGAAAVAPTLLVLGPGELVNAAASAVGARFVLVSGEPVADGPAREAAAPLGGTAGREVRRRDAVTRR